MKSYFKRSALVWWLVAMALAIVITASNYASSVGEAFLGSFAVVYALRCVVRFFKSLASVKAENSFGGMLKYGGSVFMAFFKCLKPALRWFITMMCFALIVVSTKTNSYWWLVVMALAISAIPWGKKET